MVPYNSEFTALGIFLFSFFFLLRTYKRRDILKGLPIPPAASILWGHEYSIFQQPIGQLYGKWFERLGTTYKIKAAWTEADILVTVDPAALHHIYSQNTYNYEHSPVLRPLIKRLLGGGLVWIEGRDQHRQMRSLVSPAFTLERTRTFMPSIWETARNLVSKLEKHVSTGADSEKSTRIDLTHWSEVATLDVIGKVALGHDFRMGEDEDGKAIIKAWRDQVAFGMHNTSFFATVLLKFMPWLTELPFGVTGRQSVVRETVNRLAHKLLTERIDTIEQGHDLFSIVYAALRKEGKSISSKEAVEHITTFTMVGHETTAGVLAFILHALAQNIPAQTCLREELSNAPSEPTFESLWSEDAFPYLHAVILEGSRLFPIAGHTEKVCQSDDILPLRFPITSSDGKSIIRQVPVTKGQVIHVPLICVDQLSQVWGPSVKEFRPERWLEPENSKLPSAENRTNGWSKLYIFSEGPRMCVGYRLAIAELKVFIMTLIRHFEFVDSGAQIEAAFSATMQPYVVGHMHEGVQLPVLVRSIENA